MAYLAGNNIALTSVKTTDIPQIINWSINSKESFFLLQSTLPISSEDLLLLISSKKSELYLVTQQSKNIGIIKITAIEKNNLRAQISFNMLPSNNNTKLMQEALEIIIDQIFKKYKLKKIYTHTLTHEKELKMVLAKLLFKKEGTLKEHLYFKNRHFDMEIFALDKEDYYK